MSMSSDLEARLRRVEQLLLILLRKLESIEDKADRQDETILRIPQGTNQ